VIGFRQHRGNQKEISDGSAGCFCGTGQPPRLDRRTNRSHDIQSYCLCPDSTFPSHASRRRRYACKSLQAQNFTHPVSCSVQD
jgi:hypothetical protein